MTQKEAIEKVLNLARGEIGYHEHGSNVTKYAAYLDSIAGFYNGQKNGYAWCDVFFDYLFVKSFGVDIGREMICQPMQSAGAGCLYSAQYYKDGGQWRSAPQPGDQIFFSYSAGEVSHTGIVESVANGMVNTIEGNTSDMVARRKYALASGSIVGYGRPRWELVADCSADDFSDIEIPAASVPSDSGSASGSTSAAIMKRGSKGIAVREMQEKLLKLGYDLGADGADGDYGRNTYHAVKKFQEDHGVKPVDGEVGPITSAAIEQALKELEAQESVAEDSPADSVASGGSNEPVQTTAGTIRPDPVEVISEPIDSGKKSETKGKFRVGQVVNFIGNGWYLNPNAKVGVSIRPGRVIVIAVNLAAKHPYRVRQMQRFSLQGSGWVDEDALEAI